MKLMVLWGRIHIVVLVLSLAVTSLVAAATAPVYNGPYTGWDLKSFRKQFVALPLGVAPMVTIVSAPLVRRDAA